MPREAKSSSGLSRLCARFLFSSLAHQLWDVMPRAAIQCDSPIYLFRRDSESTEIPSEVAISPTASGVDWSNIISRTSLCLCGSACTLLKCLRRIGSANVYKSWWYPARDLIIDDATRYFSQHYDDLNESFTRGDPWFTRRAGRPSFL